MDRAAGKFGGANALRAGQSPNTNDGKLFDRVHLHIYGSSGVFG